MSKVYRHYGSNVFKPECVLEVTRSRNMKPVGGFWASPIDSERSWYEWCKQEYFNLNSLELHFDFQLKPSAKILLIENEQDVRNMIAKYPGKQMDTQESFVYAPFRTPEENYLKHCPDFVAISKDYDGVEINITKCPSLYHWMYGWDVDSIVIWNPDVVELV